MVRKQQIIERKKQHKLMIQINSLFARGLRNGVFVFFSFCRIVCMFAAEACAALLPAFIIIIVRCLAVFERLCFF